jgi:RimJ/RimL family protein N-acetyltransferase
MDFNQDYILENDRVLLRPIESSDFEYLVEFSLNEPEIWQYSLVRSDGEQNLKKYIDLALKSRKNEQAYTFIVFDKLNNKYAGSTRFYSIQPIQKSMLLGFTWYGKSFQGTGLNKACKYLLLEFAFDQLNFERIEFRADLNNKRSINAMKSIGCKEEGILRSESFRPDGSRRDSIVLSILKSEWELKIKSNLKIKLQ